MKEQESTDRSSVREQKLFDMAVDTTAMFSDHKHTYRKGIEKRQTKLMEKISFLTPFLGKDEHILLLTTGLSPMTFGEQFNLGLIFFPLKRALFVFTNKRIFHIPANRNYSYRQSIAQILYADCQTIAMKGKTLAAKYKNGKKEKFYYLPRREKKKIKALLGSIALKGAQSKMLGRVHLCPRCTKELLKDEYICPNCKLEFKSESEGKRISWAYPGGGYFYTRHPVLGVEDAIVETALIIGVVTSAVDVRTGELATLGPLIVYAIALLIEKKITVYHTNHFVREFIPKEKEVQPIVGSL